jgi:hypothetical protein
MIISVYVSLGENENKFENGINIELSRWDDMDMLKIKIMDDEDKMIIKPFEIDYCELKAAILKLDFLKQDDA